jgi:hypothetical protein
LSNPNYWSFFQVWLLSSIITSLLVITSE